MVVSDFPPGNFNIASNVRQQQKRKWEESDTNKEPILLKNKSPKVKFDKVSMFLSACSSGDLDEAKQLLKYGLDINSANPDGLTALHQACIYDKLDVVEFLIGNGADINCADPEGWTPLHCAAYCGYSDITKVLIDKKADLTALNSNCELPLDLAMDKPDIYDLVLSAMRTMKIDADTAKKSEETQLIEDAKRWLQDGVRPSFCHPVSGATPLHVAAAKGYLEAIQILLEAGADIEARDNDEWTPLMAAAHWSQLNACDLLLQAGANATATSRMGYTLDDIVADDIRKELHHLLTENEKRQKPIEKPIQIKDAKSETPYVDTSKQATKTVGAAKSENEDKPLKEVDKNTDRNVPPASNSLASASSGLVSSPELPLSSNVYSVAEQPLEKRTPDEKSRTNARGIVIPIEDQLQRPSDEESLLPGNRANNVTNAKNGFRPPLSYNSNTLPPRSGNIIQQNGTSRQISSAVSPFTGSITRQQRPVSAIYPSSSSFNDDNYITSTPKQSSTDDNNSSQRLLQSNGVGSGISRALSEEYNKISSTPVVEVSTSSTVSSSPSPPSPSSSQQQIALRRPPSQRPLSALIASEDGAVDRIQSSSRSVFSMVHRNASGRHAPVITQTPASPHPSRLGVTTSTLTSTSANPVVTNSNSYNSRLRTPPFQVMSRSATSLTVSKEPSSQGSFEETANSAGGMVAVLATPVTAVTPQHGSGATPTTSLITPTAPGSQPGSANRSATDEAEAERKARARHNRQTRRATQGVTLEDFNQAKNMSATESVVATAALVNTSIGIAPSRVSSQVPPSATPVIGTVSPITHITPSVVYASSAMASSNNGVRIQPANSAQLPLGPSSSLPVTSASSNNVSNSNQPQSRRKQPPRRSTGINQADVTEAAEQLSNANGTSSKSGSQSINSTTETTNSTQKTPASAQPSAASSATRRDLSLNKPNADATQSSSTSSSSGSATGTASFLVEYDRLYELERAENERLKSQSRQMSTQLTELQRDKRSLQRRVSELEEETRELERLRAENQRLKDENCALIRVISKLSK